MTNNVTRTAVLNVAQELVQIRGYNAFSFRDLADRVRIKSASVHYYFPTKSELCRTLIVRQREELAAVFEGIDAVGSAAPERLQRYITIFRETLATDNRMCLCGMLASDFATLEAEVVEELRAAVVDHETWLARVLAAGRAAEALHFDGSELVEARSLMAGLEGAMLLARMFGDPRRFDDAAQRLLKQLGAAPALD